MTYRVIITAAAKQNLRDAYFWAAGRAPHSAALWLQRFEAELQTIAHFPERFQLAPENAFVESEVRQLIFGRRLSAYRALFTIVGEEIQVLYIRRATRDCASPDNLIVD